MVAPATAVHTSPWRPMSPPHQSRDNTRLVVAARRLKGLKGLKVFVQRVVVFAALPLLFGCDGPSADVGKELTKSSEMLKLLEPKLPAGMPLDAARTYMISHGFTVSEKKSEMFAGKGPFDFLFCIRSDGDPPIKRRWEVAVIHDSKGVSALLCRTALVYP